MALQVLKFGADVVAPDGAIFLGAVPPGIAKQKKRKKAQASGSTQSLVHRPGLAQYLSNEKGLSLQAIRDRQARHKKESVRCPIKSP